MIRTVEAYGIDFVVDFDGEPFRPAKTYGPPEDCFPASGGEATINAVYHNGEDLIDVLNDMTLGVIEQQLVEWLCGGAALEQAQEEREDRRAEAHAA